MASRFRNVAGALGRELIRLQCYEGLDLERVPLEIEPNVNNVDYLRTKKEKLGHVLHLMS